MEKINYEIRLNTIQFIMMISVMMNLNIDNVSDVEIDDEIDDSFQLSFIQAYQNGHKDYYIKMIEADDNSIVNYKNNTSSNEFENFYELMNNKKFEVSIMSNNYFYGDEIESESIFHEEFQFVFDDSFFANHAIQNQFKNILKNKRMNINK